MIKLLIGFLCMTILSSTSFAIKEGGGGDICEDRIKTIRDDLKNWILAGGHVDLKLPQGVSTEMYSKKMLSEIDNVKVIKCVGPGDKDYPVNVDGVAKVCRFDKYNKKSKLTCDFLKFNATKDSDQYVLTHHEYAGFAGLERPTGSDSNYFISNQISEYLELRVVKKLVVKKSKLIALGDLAKLENGTPRLMGQLEALEYCADQSTRLPSAREMAQLAINRGAAGLIEVPKSGPFKLSSEKPEGYYLVQTRHILTGQKDSFYFNVKGYVYDEQESLGYGLWSSSVAIDYTPSGEEYLQYNSSAFDIFGTDNYPAPHPLVKAVRCVR